MAHRVKDLVLSLLWPGFNPWPREFLHAMSAAKKKKKNDNKKEDPLLSYYHFGTDHITSHEKILR